MSWWSIRAGGFHRERLAEEGGIRRRGTQREWVSQGGCQKEGRQREERSCHREGETERGVQWEEGVRSREGLPLPSLDHWPSSEEVLHVPGPLRAGV